MQAWKADVGRAPLYLLDTNLEENAPSERAITYQLYAPGLDMRIRQELVLGIGGIRFLHAVGIDPAVCHMNEGHSAFLGIERTRLLMERTGLGFWEALEAVRAGSVFTTHTPVPAGIDLSEVRTVAGDYREDDLGQAIEPHLFRCAEILAEHARGRRTVVFLPLIDTSRKFVAACQALGLRAVHVDGNDRAGLEAFRAREADIIANAQLLSTGWDQPDVDCVMVLRPTRSLVLYSQMIGRGTRICAGKDHLLVLDPLVTGQLRRCEAPTDPLVVGIAVGAAAANDRGALEAPVAVTGLATVKADAQYGAIRAGDLLVTSATPGHAMKAPELFAAGTVVGKAQRAGASGCCSAFLFDYGRMYDLNDYLSPAMAHRLDEAADINNLGQIVASACWSEETTTVPPISVRSCRAYLLTPIPGSDGR